MTDKEKIEGMLSPYRALDLTDEKGVLCGKILGDLGADVIKIEKPGGDPARNLGPFYHDEPDPEKSLFWLAYNTSKRGITLNIESADGQEIFKKLVKGADVVIESFSPGYMDSLGLGYSTLEKINPGVIMVSITPFGQTGPYRNYKTSDIVAWAMGGYMYSCGDMDRAPVRISHHSHAYLHAGVRAAAGAMMALYHRELTGEGQQVDTSIQESVVGVSIIHTVRWDMMKANATRSQSGGSGARMRQMWPCKDGYVMFGYWGGVEGPRRSRPLVEYMDSEGMANDFLKGFDWKSMNTAQVTQEIKERIEEPTAKFFMKHTKAELLEAAAKYHFHLCPVSTTKDIVESVQLAARDFWVELEHPELGTAITYPGAFAPHASAAPAGISRRAPLIGEHNQEIYESELGISRNELLMLKQAGVI